MRIRPGDRVRWRGDIAVDVVDQVCLRLGAEPLVHRVGRDTWWRASRFERVNHRFWFNRGGKK